jgi:hypothetical protein
MVIWYIFPVLVSFSEENLATLTVARATINQSLHGISVSHVTKKHCRVNGPWTVVIIAIASRFFVERSSTIERYCQPPPQFWKRLSAACALFLSRSPPQPCQNNLHFFNFPFTITIYKCNFKSANLQVQFTTAINKLRSTTGRMPALVLSITLQNMSSHVQRWRDVG